MTVEPDMIHIIPYDASINHYEGTVTEISEDKATVRFADFTLTVPCKQVFGDGEAAADTKVVASFVPENADLSDDSEAGVVAGNIISFIYIDNYYRYVVRSEENEEDYMVCDEYLWNQGDRVSVLVPEDSWVFEIKGRA